MEAKAEGVAICLAQDNTNHGREDGASGRYSRASELLTVQCQGTESSDPTGPPP